MVKTRVAFVLSGGSSAGSYIAGALDELLRAFRATDQYEIDIITGASAGSTNAALIAHGLCYRDGETDLHRVWVDGVDIVDLLDRDIDDDDPFSVLSARHLRRLASNTIAWSDAAGPGTRAGFCAPNLTVAMTLGNATPLSYESRVPQPTAAGEETFVQKRNAELESYVLDESVGPRDALWERIGSVAQASSAIPFIFPMVRLSRRAEDPRHYLQRPNFTGERQFWYYDGGTYNNLPIDLAWHYITEEAKVRRADPLLDRRVIVVDPWRSDRRPVTEDTVYPGLLAHAFNMLRDVRTESSMIQFEREVVEPLSAIKGLRQLPGVGRPPVDLLRTFALVIPREGDPPLRSVYLNHLSAFLDRAFREYDFRRGAADARRAATALLKIDYQQRPEPFYAPDADGGEIVSVNRYATLEDIPSSRKPGHNVREVFEEALEDRVRALVKHFNLPGPDNRVTDAFVTRIVNGIVRDKLPTLWNGG
jgi:predicted acylesterase/phospholipase RssA